MADLTENVRAFAESFAEAIENQDFTTAHSALAPWLQSEVASSAFELEIETQLREVGEGFDLDEIVYPDGHTLDTGVLSYEDLSGGDLTAKEVSSELTAENFVNWIVIQFLCEDDALDVDAWFDFWFAAVRHEGRLAIGYYEILDPD